MTDEKQRARIVFLVLREDEPGHGEWFAKQREASLKATWLREKWKANARVVRATIEDDPTPPPSRRPTSLRP